MAFNFMDRLNLRNIFNTPPSDPFQNRTQVFDVPQITIPTSEPDTGLSLLRKRPTPFLEEYRKALLAAPKRSDYQRNKLGKALALAAGGLTGATEGISRGVAAGRDILDQPFNRAMEDYGITLGSKKELADLEYRGLGDEQKLEVAIAKDEIERQKSLIDQLKAISDLKLNDARAKELLDRIQRSGRSLQRNEITGQLEVVNMNDGTRMPIGQFVETPEAKAKREFSFFQKREGIQQANRKEIENIRLKNDEYLARIKKQMENRDVSATQDNAAFEGAYKEILTEFPDMKAILFTVDDKTGNLILKVDKQGNPINPDAYNMFINAVRDRKNMKLGGQSSGLSPNIQVPQDRLRSAAIQAIKETYPDNPELLTNEEAIQEAIRQIQSAFPAEMEGAFNIETPGYQPPGIFRNIPTNIQTPPNAFNIPDAYPPLFGQPSRTSRELNYRGVSNGIFR